MSTEREWENRIVVWEAHRGGGGGYEMPESCLAGFEYGWMLGARPEADVNRTADGVFVSVHDNTLDRIIENLPQEWRGRPIGELTYRQIRSCDPGGSRLPGQRIPSLEELFARLKDDPRKGMILDDKNAEPEALAALVAEYGVAGQLTFASCRPEKCAEVKSRIPEIRIKVWIGGCREAVLNQFHALAEKEFHGFEEVQLHLNDRPGHAAGGWRYELTEDDVSDALRRTRDSGVLLQVLPWNFEREDLFRILDLGVRSFAVDYPVRFVRGCAEYFSKQDVRGKK